MQRTPPRRIIIDMTGYPALRHVLDDVLSRHPLADRAEVLEMLCMPLADPLHGRLDGTAWTRRAIEAVGVAVDQEDADAIIRRAHLHLDPSDDEQAAEKEWEAELEAAGIRREQPAPPTFPAPSMPGGNWLVEAIERHRLTLTPQQLAIEDATGLAEQEICGPGPLADVVVALELRMTDADAGEADRAGAEYLTLVLDEGLALDMDRYVLAMLVWSEGGRRPHGYGDDGTGPRRPPKGPAPRGPSPTPVPRRMATA